MGLDSNNLSYHHKILIVCSSVFALVFYATGWELATWCDLHMLLCPGRQPQLFYRPQSGCKHIGIIRIFFFFSFFWFFAKLQWSVYCKSWNTKFVMRCRIPNITTREVKEPVLAWWWCYSASTSFLSYISRTVSHTLKIIFSLIPWHKLNGSWPCSLILLLTSIELFSQNYNYAQVWSLYCSVYIGKNWPWQNMAMFAKMLVCLFVYFLSLNKLCKPIHKS